MAKFVPDEKTERAAPPAGPGDGLLLEDGDQLLREFRESLDDLVGQTLGDEVHVDQHLRGRERTEMIKTGAIFITRPVWLKFKDFIVIGLAN